jgi:hypothetical protein
MPRRITLAAVVALLALAAVRPSPRPAAAATAYTITPIDGLTFPFSLNSRGQVLDLRGDKIWHNGAVTTIQFPSGLETHTPERRAGIDDTGNIILSFQVDYSPCQSFPCLDHVRSHSFYGRSGTWTTIGEPYIPGGSMPGTSTVAHATSGSGYVAGVRVDWGNLTAEGFVWRDGRLAHFSLPPEAQGAFSLFSVSLAVNNLGQIAGAALINSVQPEVDLYQLFRSESGIRTPGPVVARNRGAGPPPLVINDLGEVLVLRHTHNEG